MSRRSVCLSVFLVLICWVAVTVPASAQHFKQVAGSLSQVAAGRNEVWGLNASGQTYRRVPHPFAFFAKGWVQDEADAMPTDPQQEEEREN